MSLNITTLGGDQIVTLAGDSLVTKTSTYTPLPATIWVQDDAVPASTTTYDSSDIEYDDPLTAYDGDPPAETDPTIWQPTSGNGEMGQE